MASVDGVLSSSSNIFSNGTGTYTTATILDLTHFNYPWILLVVFLASFITHSILTAEYSDESGPMLTGPGGKPLPRSVRKTKQDRDKLKSQDFSPVRKLLFLWLSAGILVTFLGNAINIVVHALDKRENGWWCGEATAIYVCASLFFYSVFLISLVDTAPSPSIAHQVTWLVALVGELVLLAASLSLYTSAHRELNSLLVYDPDFHKYATQWEIVELVLDTIRVVLLLFCVAFYCVFTLELSFKYRNKSRQPSSEPDENSPLLFNGRANGNGHVSGNGSIANASAADSVSLNGHVIANGSAAQTDIHGRPIDQQRVDEVPAFYKPTTATTKTWWEYLKGYSLFFPYLWPARSARLQIVVVVCFLLVVMQRIVNIAVPLQVGRVTDALTGDDKEATMPWVSISLLIVFKFLQGSSGILGAARSVLWIPISQYSYKALTTASFEHVHGLSLDFHLGKRTGEVLSALSKGNAINNFLEQVTFQVLPMIFDLGVAIGYFAYAFDAYYALVVSIITFSYIYLTIRMARWRSDQRRQMQNLSREEDAVKNDSLTSYETVKYFNAETYEFDRYRQAVSAFQKMEFKVTISLNILNISQNLVFMAGLLVTSFIAAYQVTTGKRQVGQFVTLITYMGQLQQPLNFFGSFYRGIQSAMISGERLLELFKEEPTVIDESSAEPLPACEGRIDFNHVKFSYDTRKPALEDLTFTCKPGTTTAFVGESGGGKSTVFRLLFRFYNTQNGSIQLDGHDIRDVTIDSLRHHIGVVPQDTILFNETLMYNLRYANQDATDEDIFNACRAASIHDKILAFPDGYDTKVGERGLRLSGGEKQRVAIARTIIKNPRIIMLDEATAALDSDTEQHIQEALKTLSEGRTMLVIAHRLSTITSADQILVLHAGRVAEAGTHSELLLKKGRYAQMWKKQIRAERAAEKASEMVARARALSEAASIQTPGNHRSKANNGSAEVSEYEGDNHSNRTLVASTLATRALTRTTERRNNNGDSSSSKSNSSSDSDDHKSDEDKKTGKDKSGDKKGAGTDKSKKR
ncbi:putative Heavy metal tolerance protein [Sclerotinia borealis F-4128]|uniref:Putative Heavy metal tolerance protein n=1 Tax=Sclerotinia borealis (strain F-4128) TaxID=1432307 RepID=W9CNP5_SCLBF|nr:putative Heavy metal tolerance protein [Sclerotinia borealis F-4128]